MFSKTVLHEVPYQNQMQFNLGIPLTTKNLVTHFHQPSPIMIERMGGHRAIPGGVKQPIQGANMNVSAASSANYSILSEEKMARMSQLAQRNLKNMKLQAQMKEKNQGASNVNFNPVLQGRRQKPPSSAATCSRQRRDVASRPKFSRQTRETAKNRPVGEVPVPQPKQLVSQTRTEGDSMISVSKDASAMNKDTFFPAKAASQDKNVEAPKGELGKVEVEIEESLKLLKQIGERALAEGNTRFLQPPQRGKRKEGYLFEQEGLDRAQLRSEEQHTRFNRSLYNMRQRVKRLQRDTTQADLNVPSQKRHIQNQLVVTYRNASRAMETFLNQLPFQDLSCGFPTHYSELNLLLQHLTGLSNVVGQGADGQDQNKILNLLDELDDINSQWSTQYLQGARHPNYPRDKKGFVNREWVSDTKVQPDLFSKMGPSSGLRLAHGPPQRPSASLHSSQPKKAQQRGRPAKRASGKENKKANVRFQDKNNMPSKSAMAALAGQSQVGFVPVGKGRPQQAPSVAWEVNLGKSYMLPTDLIAQRERAQRAVEISNQNAANFAQPTMSSRLRSSPHRPSSAPASQRRKEVNFDLEPKSLLPWIPAGSGPYRPRSASLEQCSFSQRDLDNSNLSHGEPSISPFAGSLKVNGRDRGDARQYGFRSLPSQQQLRSQPVSDSFLDHVERRLFDRMMQRKVADTKGSSVRTDQMAQSLHQRDEALDITDLYVEGDSSINGTATNEETVRREAAGLMDAPTLENIRLRLDDMQRKEREIRERWSTIKFADSKPLTRKTHYDYPPDPVALYSNNNKDTRSYRRKEHSSDCNKSWSEDPLLFTKSLANHSCKHKGSTKLANIRHPPPGANQTKKLVSVKQTMVERIMTDRDRFDSHLRRKSHHPSGKFDPWNLVEEISDEILMDCLQDVSEEVEKINEEIANHMYKSEFLVTSSPPGNNIASSPPPADIPTVPRRAIAATTVHEGRGGGVGGQFRSMLGSASHPHFETFGSYHQDVATKESDSEGDDDFVTAGHTPRYGSGDDKARPMRALEPLLEDISHLMSRKNGDSEDESGESAATRKVGEELETSKKVVEENKYNEDDDEEEYEDEDDEDDDNYSDDDDFEEISDVEL